MNILDALLYVCLFFLGVFIFVMFFTDEPQQEEKQNQDNKIQSCKYCGRKNVELAGNETEGYWCKCKQCLASTAVFNSKAEAIKDWNMN